MPEASRSSEVVAVLLTENEDLGVDGRVVTLGVPKGSSRDIDGREPAGRREAGSGSTI